MAMAIYGPLGPETDSTCLVSSSERESTIIDRDVCPLWRSFIKQLNIPYFFALCQVESHVKDALSKGAKCLRGGQRHELGGNFFQPTILTDVTRDMIICSQETFGPVAPLIR